MNTKGEFDSNSAQDVLDCVDIQDIPNHIKKLAIDALKIRFYFSDMEFCITERINKSPVRKAQDKLKEAKKIYFNALKLGELTVDIDNYLFSARHNLSCEVSIDEHLKKEVSNGRNLLQKINKEIDESMKEVINKSRQERIAKLR